MLKLDDQGLIPAIVQEASTGQVLMLGYMSLDSLRRTFATGQVWFFSRSRQELWHKGATSGNYLRLRSITADCDRDALLMQVDPAGPVCHTGEQSCFFNSLSPEDVADLEAKEPVAEIDVLDEVYGVILERQRSARGGPEGSYVAGLFKQGIDRIAQKVIEEAGEAAIAAKNPEKERIVGEVADLWFHSLILLAASGLTPDDVRQELRQRRH